MGEDEVRSLVDEDGTEDAGDGGDGLVSGAAGEFPHFHDFTVTVKGDDEEFFCGKVGELWGEEVVNVCGVLKAGGVGAIPGGAGAKLKCG